MKKISTLWFALLSCLATMGQFVQIEPIEFKDGRAAGNSMEAKMKDAPKKIFINRFRVFYELVYVDTETAQAGVNRGASSVALTVGFVGVDEKMLIENTDRIYAEFLEMIIGNGYEIVKAEAAKDLKAYKDWTMLEGGKINNAQYPGVAMVYPSGFQYYAKEVLPSGKEKMSFFDPSGFASNQLGKIPVVNVDITVKFMTDSESGASKAASSALGGLAKVVATPYFRISADDTKSTFNWAAQASVINTPMKSDLVINGVFKYEKFKAAKAAQLNTTYDVGIHQYVISDDVNTSSLQMATCDINAYKQGLYDATSKYVSESTEIFLNFARGKK